MTVSESTSNVTAVVDEFVDAYNAQDFVRLQDVFSEDVYVIHHNRGVEAKSKQELFGLFEAFGAAFPDRRFHNQRRRLVDGDTVVVEHTWEGTAAADVPGFAAAGDVARLDLCTVITIRHGRVVEYHDYG
ncbi:MAG: nuclear transport factor 2 family protein [Acidimicrobiales bacterium]